MTKNTLTLTDHQIFLAEGSSAVTITLPSCFVVVSQSATIDEPNGTSLILYKNNCENLQQNRNFSNPTIRHLTFETASKFCLGSVKPSWSPFH